MDTPDAPIVVNASPLVTQVNTGLRDLALLGSALPTLLALLGKHDVLGLINWAASQPAAPIVGMAVTGGVFVWRQLHARWARAEKVVLAAAAPNDVAIVK